VLGKKSGKASITYHLEQMGLKDVSDDAVSEMLRCVKQLGETKRGLLDEAEFKEIVDSVLSRRAVAPA
jgi:methanogen homocitrate synthase